MFDRGTHELLRNFLFARLVFVFRFASRTAEHSTDQLLPLLSPFPTILYFRHLSLPERPMKIEVVVDPSRASRGESRLTATPSLASRFVPVENTAVVTNHGTETARSVAAGFS